MAVKSIKNYENCTGPNQAAILAAARANEKPSDTDARLSFKVGYSFGVLKYLRLHGVDFPNYRKPGTVDRPRISKPLRIPQPEAPMEFTPANTWELVHGRGRSIRRTALTFGVSMPEVFRALEEHQPVVLAAQCLRRRHFGE